MPKAINYTPDPSLPRELPVPAATSANKDAREFIRVWFDGNKIDVSIQPKVAPRPEAVGLMLADIVKHACIAHGHAFPKRAADDAGKIVEVLFAELGGTE